MGNISFKDDIVIPIGYKKPDPRIVKLAEKEERINKEIIKEKNNKENIQKEKINNQKNNLISSI